MKRNMSVSLDEEVITKIDTLAKSRGTTRSAILNKLMKDATEPKRTYDYLVALYEKRMAEREIIEAEIREIKIQIEKARTLDMKNISVNLDDDVLEWLNTHGEHQRSRTINAAMRNAMWDALHKETTALVLAVMRTNMSSKGLTLSKVTELMRERGVCDERISMAIDTILREGSAFEARRDVYKVV